MRWTRFFRGRAAYYRPATPAGRAETIGLFERALALDLHSVEAQSWLALTLVSRVANQMSGTEAADTARAEELIAQVLAASPNNLVAHYAEGLLLANMQHRCAEAIPEFEAVIACDRNGAPAFANLGRCRSSAGSIEKMIPAQEQAIRLSPRDQLVYYWYWNIGAVHLLQSRTDEAIVWKVTQRQSGVSIHSRLAHLRLRPQRPERTRRRRTRRSPRIDASGG